MNHCLIKHDGSQDIVESYRNLLNICHCKSTYEDIAWLPQFSVGNYGDDNKCVAKDTANHKTDENCDMEKCCFAVIVSQIWIAMCECYVVVIHPVGLQKCCVM